MPHTVLSPGHLRLVPQLLECRRNGFPVIALDFDPTVLTRPPTPARLFEVFGQGLVVIRGQVQVFDECHHLAATAFGGPLYDGRLLCGREGNLLRDEWRRFAQIAVFSRIHESIVVSGHTEFLCICLQGLGPLHQEPVGAGHILTAYPGPQPGIPVHLP